VAVGGIGVGGSGVEVAAGASGAGAVAGLPHPIKNNIINITAIPSITFD
jgi:hypothetical protein